ncbi:hypothetical protein KDX31_05760 [Amphritea atlantica]|uniref:Uncharacterized protein n=1 Tax=Amphritea atlantica TaxID=355243 RepID=A0ABY5GY82_9GAMM|nr:hypothetical protein KDX31_05760 [Amphritea atlantica]
MSLRKAINEMCTQCIYDKHQEGGKLQQVAKCSSQSCPLFNVRPLPKGSKE